MHKHELPWRELGRAMGTFLSAIVKKLLKYDSICQSYTQIQGSSFLALTV